MSKRLIIVLALALVAGISCAAYAEVQNVKVSGDITVYGLSRYLSLTSQQAENTVASIARVRVDADLTDNIIATVRLLNERYWGDEVEVTGYGDTGATPEDKIPNTEIALDLAYVTLKEFLYSPLTLTIGRQELHFGNDMIIGDPDTNNQASNASPFGRTIDPDLSARKAFDSVRATLNYDPLVVDVVYAQVKRDVNGTADAALWTAASVDVLSGDDQEQLYGANLNYALSDKTTLEGYAWERRKGRKAVLVTTNKVDRTDVVGGRIVTTPIENLTYQLEAAYQFGKKVTGLTTVDTATRSAWAAETALTYNMPDMTMTPSATVLYGYYSGNKGKDYTNTAWDPMYENQTFGNIANDLFNQSNAHIVGGMVSVKPVDDVTLKGEYYAYWWDKKFGENQSITAGVVATGETIVMQHKKFAGQEIDLTATYDYTEDVQFALMGGLLIPGPSFDKNNRHKAGEVIGSMKVTF